MRRFLSLVRALAIVVLPAVLVSGCRCPACLPDANCAYQLSAPGSPMHAPGGSVLEQVTAPVGCKWAFKGDVPWITVEAGSEGEPAGNGNGSVVIRVAANIGPRRAGTATIAYHKVTIDQAGTDGAGACTFQLFPATTASGAAGGPAAFAVVPSAPDCGWFAEAPSPDGLDRGGLQPGRRQRRRHLSRSRRLRGAVRPAAADRPGGRAQRGPASGGHADDHAEPIGAPGALGRRRPADPTAARLSGSLWQNRQGYG